jgi:hypothetical protein
LNAPLEMGEVSFSFQLGLLQVSIKMAFRSLFMAVYFSPGNTFPRPTPSDAPEQGCQIFLGA